jgi:hypothetical protein
MTPVLTISDIICGVAFITAFAVVICCFSAVKYYHNDKITAVFSKYLGFIKSKLYNSTKIK